MIVYVAEQGATVTRRRGRIVVAKGPSTLQNVHLFDLEQVVLFGMIQVTTQALRALLAHGVDTVYLTLSGRFLGRLSSGLGKNIELRRTQFRSLGDAATATNLARRYVEGKLRNYVVLLRRHNRTLRSQQVAGDSAGIRRCVARLDEADTVDEIRGLEGAGSARYFSALRSLLRAPGMAFFKRARRPPPDPINILLSLGYTMLGNLVHGMCEAAGLDPYLGALHTVSYGRPSLALDLIEEFRPVIVDATVIRAVNTRQIGASDFVRVSEEDLVAEEEIWRQLDEARSPDTEEPDTAPPRQVMITSAGLKKWLLAFERRLDDRTHHEGTGTQLAYRQVLREQVHAFARHLRGEQQYQPFLMRH